MFWLLFTAIFKEHQYIIQDIYGVNTQFCQIENGKIQCKFPLQHHCMVLAIYVKVMLNYTTFLIKSLQYVVWCFLKMAVNKSQNVWEVGIAVCS